MGIPAEPLPQLRFEIIEAARIFATESCIIVRAHSRRRTQSAERRAAALHHVRQIAAIHLVEELIPQSDRMSQRCHDTFAW